jgi:hypothetical protein
MVTQIDGRKILDHANNEIFRLAELNEIRGHDARVAIIEEIFRDFSLLLEPFYSAEVGSGEVAASAIEIPPPLRVQVRPEVNAAAHRVARAALRFWESDSSDTESTDRFREATAEYRRLVE